MLEELDYFISFVCLVGFLFGVVTIREHLLKARPLSLNN